MESDQGTTLARARPDGAFDPPVPFGPAMKVRALDLTGDGRTDLLRLANDTLEVLIAGPDGSLRSTGIHVLGPLLATADFDGDGDTDLAVGISAVRILANDGNGHFTAGLPALQLDQGFAAPGAADVDGDGLSDLVVSFPVTACACCGDPQGEVGDSLKVFLATRDGSFRPGLAVPLRTARPYDCLRPRETVAADLDGDGRIDLGVMALTQMGFGSVFLLLNRGADGFVEAPEQAARGENSTALRARDLDLDQDADLLLASSQEGAYGRLQIFYNRGDATFEEEVHWLDFGMAQDVAVGDFDGDLKPDLAAALGYIQYHSPAFVTLPNVGVSISTPILASSIGVQVRDGVVILSWWTTTGDALHVERRRAGERRWIDMGEPRAEGADRVSFEDRTVTAGERYGYRLRIGEGAGASHAGEVEVTIPIGRLAIQSVRPNPSAGAVRVSLALDRGAPARLEVVNLAGRRVRVITVEAFASEVGFVPGATWVPGIYWLRLLQDGRCATARFALLR